MKLRSAAHSQASEALYLSARPFARRALRVRAGWNVRTSPAMFELLEQDCETKARAGRIMTAHGAVETPVFMPVGTQGSVKAVSPDELRELRAQIILGNTYHLFVRPGLEVITRLGGLHRFMNWDGPILTDSGGYQIFSLAKLRRITEEGVAFQNHIDGAPAFISPEIAVEAQAALGGDIVMALDECVPYPCQYDYAAQSAEMTTRWARRCKAAWQRRMDRGSIAEAHLPATRDESSAMKRQLLFGIVQGATFENLRRASAQAVVDLDFDGYAVGGISVGEPEAEMMRAVETVEPLLPPYKPRYAMGLGTPPQMLEMIARGMDMFDCVLPTRLARNGTAFTATGTMNLKNAEFILDRNPIEPECACYACRGFSRGYIRHLIKAEEILGLRLITLHNLHFYLHLVARARNEIRAGTFNRFRREFLETYKTRSSNDGL